MVKIYGLDKNIEGYIGTCKMSSVELEEFNHDYEGFMVAIPMEV